LLLKHLRWEKWGLHLDILRIVSPLNTLDVTRGVVQ
jgi:hypothetical protein